VAVSLPTYSDRALPFRNLGKFQPFLEVNFGGERVGVSCNSGNAGNACDSITAVQPLPTTSAALIIVARNPNATSVSKNAFAMTTGGGFDIKLNRKFAIRLVQAKYLYTRFGNDCQFAVCSDNRSQNSFRLKSGIVMSWGGMKEAVLPPPPAPPKMKTCPAGVSVPIRSGVPQARHPRQHSGQSRRDLPRGGIESLRGRRFAGSRHHSVDS
jgi:hypothetical protein